jgi:hypothetical protein
MKPIIAPFQKALIPVLAALFLPPAVSYSQQLHDDAEGSKAICYHVNRGARIDSASANPAPDKVNGSAKCVKYMRTRAKYDCLKMYPLGKIADVSNYTTYEDNAPKLRMKVFTSAPVGTLIEIQLGKKTGNPFPEGTHSQFQAKTTTSNAWEELEFVFAQNPKGSMTGPTEIDQVTILFDPNTLTNDTYYFDDLIGPTISKTSEQTAKAGRRRN